jgi:GNAT superfamily N-acetyltransferase
LSAGVSIDPFQDGDVHAVQDLFVLVNRQLAPQGARDAFEAYIARSLTEEMARITMYYGERGGGFWVARRAGQIVGMFGLERSAQGPCQAMELRRMYVDPSARRCGIAGSMLQFAEAESRRLGASRLELSTSELQSAALELYRRAGYRLVREEVADQARNKTVGGGIRRYHFEKRL